MVINKQLVLSSLMAGLIVLEGRTDWDFPHSNNVAQCKSTLSTQSVEQVGALIETRGIVTWRKKLALEELSQRNTPISLKEIERLNSDLSVKRDRDSCELCAKIAVDVIRRSCKTEQARIDALAQMLDSKKVGFLNEAVAELLAIGSSNARQALLLREEKGSILAKEARLSIDIKGLSMEEAIDYLLKPVQNAFLIYGKDANRKVVAESTCLQGLKARDARAFLAMATNRRQQLLKKKEQQTEADIRYGQYLQEQCDAAKTSIKNVETFVARRIMSPGSNAVQQVNNVRDTAPLSSNVVPAKVVLTPSPPPPRSEHKTFTRPEERGEDYSGKDSTALISILSQSKDKIELKKATKVLGDRSIAGTLKLTESEKASLTNIVQKCLQQVTSTDSNERSDGREQIERLWWSAVPGLFNNIANENPAICEVALKSLSLMRNEEIIRSLMEIAKQCTHEPTRMMAIIALGNMTEKRESLVPGRLCMDEATSRELAEKQIRPFLNTLLATEKNAEMKSLLERALKTLDEAPDRRLIRVPSK
jgi:hypothetical protein